MEFNNDNEKMALQDTHIWTEMETVACNHLCDSIILSRCLCFSNSKTFRWFPTELWSEATSFSRSGVSFAAMRSKWSAILSVQLNVHHNEMCRTCYNGIENVSATHMDAPLLPTLLFICYRCVSIIFILRLWWNYSYLLYSHNVIVRQGYSWFLRKCDTGVHSMEMTINLALWMIIAHR